MTDDLVARLRGLAPDSDMPATRSAMLEAAHVIEYERASRAKAENERDDASKALENLLDPKVQSMRLENGKFDVALCGEVVQRLAVIVTGWFRESGAKNYVEMTLNARDEPFERYTFTVQKRGDGAQSPHELRLTAEARVRELEAELAQLRVVANYNREQAEKAERALAEARKALEPFAQIADVEDEVGREYEDDRVWVVQAYGCQIGDLTVEDFRAARRAYEGVNADG